MRHPVRRTVGGRLRELTRLNDRDARDGLPAHVDFG